VALGVEAPPGRTVAWVTAQERDVVVLTLHTARIPGDLRRELRFEASDALPDRAQALVFALAQLAREREAALAALGPEPARERAWEVEARGLASLAIGEGALGGGGNIVAHRLLPFGLSAGLGVELNGSSARGTGVTQGGAWAEANLRFTGLPVAPRLTLGVGAMLNVLSRAASTETMWLPLFRAAVDATWRFFEGHGLTLGLSTHFSTRTLPLGGGMGMGASSSSLGPLWLRVELGYSLSL
jgi:hypothetical protein